MKWEQIKAKYKDRAFPIIDESIFDDAVNELLDENAALKADIARMFELLKQKNRALWLARAEKAESEADWYSRFCGHIVINIFSRVPTDSKQRQMDVSEWVKVWQKVADLCRKKADEYK